MREARAATSASGVSMRATVWNSMTLPASPCARTAIEPPGFRTSAIPGISKRSRLVRPSDAAFAAASLLAMLALVTLTAKALVEWWSPEVGHLEARGGRAAEIRTVAT